MGIETSHFTKKPKKDSLNRQKAGLLAIFKGYQLVNMDD
jgi:hypothetical protein